MYYLYKDLIVGRVFIEKDVIEYSTRDTQEEKEELKDMCETLPTGIYTFSLPFISLGEIKMGKVTIEKPKKL